MRVERVFLLTYTPLAVCQPHIRDRAPLREAALDFVSKLVRVFRRTRHLRFRADRTVMEEICRTRQRVSIELGLTMIGRLCG